MDFASANPATRADYVENTSGGDETKILSSGFDTRAANAYVVQICPDPLSETSSRQIGLPTKSSFSATGLTAGSKYWFRVAAIGTAGQGPRSDQSMKMAP